MLIYLLRHGIAEDAGPGRPDHERALNEEGWQRLRRAAPTWRKLCTPPDVVFVSPLRRAQETATVFCEAVRATERPRTDTALVPEASAEEAITLLRIEQQQGRKSVAMIGHEPHLGYLLGSLLTGHPRLPVPFKKGMLVGVETVSTASLVANLRLALTQKTAAELC